MTELWQLSAVDLAAVLRAGEVTAVEVTEHFLGRIELVNDQVGAFSAVTAERALDRARKLDAQRTTVGSDSGELPLLWGLPIGDKDLSDRAGVVTGHGSRAGGEVATASSPEVLAMDAAGAVSLGKTSTPEFGLYGYTEPEAGPVARHPADLSLGAGGSSGGAAVAVAAGLVPFAPGSDGGGSIRIPAACVGIVGFKPSREFLPIDRGDAAGVTGVVNGALAKNVADAALLLDALSWNPQSTAPRDSAAQSQFRSALGTPLGTLRIGVTTDSPWHRQYDIALGPGIVEALALAVDVFERSSEVEIEVSDEVTFPNEDYSSLFLTAWRRAAAQISPRFDRSRMEVVTQAQISAGDALTPAEIAQNVAELSAYGDDLASRFSAFDVVITPSLAQPFHTVGQWSADATENFEQQARLEPYSSWVNVAGLPAVSLPTRQTVTSPSGAELPVSVQLIGRRGEDTKLLALAAWLEPLHLSR